MVNTDLVIDFVNTAGWDPEREDLPTPGALRAWLSAHGLDPGARVPTVALEEARAAREALRDILLAHNEVDTDVARASEVLDTAAQRSGLGIRFAAGSAHAEPSASGARGALGWILAEVSAGMADGTWERMKACRADDCKYAFLDTAKNRSRAWCSMQSCGNRAKVAAYRERHTA